ncbi:YciI family protein [Arthrobacter sp. 35W]|uniref:YciI family protein n=1 Tax=Arthrobacter sp. 35W TaxID=1132441 RepID=UPI00042151D4|nr:YciI family protein [Arthrobacter sp. 35W]
MSVYAVEYVYGPEAAQIRDEHRPAHRAWLASLVETGQVLASGPFADGAGALLVFQAADEAALNELLVQDPFNGAGGIAGAKITEWNPVIGALAPLIK